MSKGTEVKSEEKIATNFVLNHYILTKNFKRVTEKISDPFLYFSVLCFDDFTVRI